MCKKGKIKDKITRLSKQGLKSIQFQYYIIQILQKLNQLLFTSDLLVDEFQHHLSKHELWPASKSNVL